MNETIIGNVVQNLVECKYEYEYEYVCTLTVGYIEVEVYQN